MEEQVYITDLLYNNEEADFINNTLSDLIKTGNYELRCKLSDDIKVHSEGNIDLMRALLSAKFPTEAEYLKEYRLTNLNKFGCITKTYFNKVLTTLSRIQRAEDYVVSYKPVTSKAFLTVPFQGYDSLEDWYFQYALKYLLQEPNGYMIVLDTAIYLQLREVTNIFPPLNETLGVSISIVPTHLVVYEDYDFLVIELIKTEKEEKYLTFTSNGVYITAVSSVYNRDYKNSLDRQTFETYIIGITSSYTFPCIKFGGISYSLETVNVFESLISGVVPYWNQALIENSDKLAIIKQHTFPERWRTKIGNCINCSGTGEYETYDSQTKNYYKSVCGVCNGSGEAANSVFTEHVFEVKGLSELGPNIPIPGVGYIEKDTKMVEFLDKDIKQNIYNGLSSLNLEFLMDVPLNQSGVAKEYDRQEINTFVYNIAYHAINSNFLPLIRLVAKFSNVNTSIDVSIPSSFDFLRNDEERQLINAVSNNFSKGLINLYEKRLLENSFDVFKDTKNITLLMNKFNPFPYESIEVISNMYATGGITHENHVLALNLKEILSDVYYNNGEENFMLLSYADQKEILYTFVHTYIMNNFEKDDYEEALQSQEKEDEVEVETTISDNDEYTANNNLIIEKDVKKKKRNKKTVSES